MLRSFFIGLTIICCSAASLGAQPGIKPPTPAPQTRPQTAPPTNRPANTPSSAPALTFKKLPSGMQYAFVIDKPTGRKPKEGDLIRIHMRSIAVNAQMIMYDSYNINKGKPAEFTMSLPAFKGDVVEAIALMSEGDSIIAVASADAVFKNNPNTKKPDFIKSGEQIEYQIRLVSLKTKEQVQKEQQEKMNKQIQEQLAKQQKELALQKAKDEKALKQFFTKKALNPTATGSGMYYSIQQEGSGEKPRTGYNVKMNYTGYLLDDTKFDSNVDTAFNHTTPFEFKLGTNAVIKGWDEGVALLNKGSKATFYIPSHMAYGSMARPGSDANPKGIPANSCLVFEVELLDFSAPVNEDAEIQKYLSEKNIKATKTASGLYYVITQTSDGEQAQNDKKVSMNYTGMLLDDTKFDSNTDPAFGHVSPFEFTLGKGMVIKGWDEGVALLKKGEKATFIIPSTLAYGAQSMPGNAANPKGIPANSILVFDVELTDIKD